VIIRLSHGFGFGRSSLSSAACGSVMTSRSSFGPRLRLGDFVLGFLGILFYHRIGPLSEGSVPPPGFEPGRPNWARGCKPRLTANSSTGGHVAPNVGTGAGLRMPFPLCLGRSARPLISGHRVLQKLIQATIASSALAAAFAFASPALVSR
jgi:hypothetical protein